MSEPKVSYTLSQTVQTAGEFELWPGFVVGVKKKPDDDHIDNMEKAFGWKWRAHDRPDGT